MAAAGLCTQEVPPASRRRGCPVTVCLTARCATGLHPVRSQRRRNGLTSLSSADELSAVTVRLWPTAYVFKQGHRIRIQVSSGAFPRFARNPGTGELTRYRHHVTIGRPGCVSRPEHTSAVILPVRT
ncbi:CocE/NonD family hydrolase C-terminal non-catalytic domain-containing protein [Arthrobacter sp.]|uniref:CocE/NonD family hydrolase C-terminal non-catalytic domain-containing protein n=1 Tax=Arthrobacter sp. TaxID=1667 RepID=UPI0035C7326A